MKYLLIILFFSFTKLSAQQVLKFDKRFVESEDKWVAFEMGKDSLYPFGFIYIDAQAGLTFNYEGDFKIGQTGIFVPKKLDEANIKVRLEPNDVLVSFIPPDKFNELKISAIPEWLQSYKTDTGSIKRLYDWGFRYNAWGECAKALSYLERAEKINPKYKGLAVELAYSYNCLKQYDKSELILEEEIKTNSTDAYVNKEYIFTLTKIPIKINKAVSHFERTLKTLNDHQYDAENCYNILQCFYNQKDKVNFNKWYGVLQNFPIKNEMIKKYANNMKANLEK